MTDVKRPPRCASRQPTQSALIPETRDHAATQAVYTGSAARVFFYSPGLLSSRGWARAWVPWKECPPS